MRVLALVLVAGCGRYGFAGADADPSSIDDAPTATDDAPPGTADAPPGTADAVAILDAPPGTPDAATPDAVPVSGMVSCAGIQAETPNAPTGVHSIDPDGDGPSPAFDVYCDMTTDGGGWTLILNYVHAGGTSPALTVRTTSLPLLGSDTLGANEAGTAFWGHAAPALVAQLPVSQLRFSCRSSTHTRVLDFVTTSAMCIDYARTGTGACLDIRLTSTMLPGHTAMLPLESTHVIGEAGDYALTEDTFFKNTMPKANWAIARAGAWECDAQATGAGSHTIHRVWVR